MKKFLKILALFLLFIPIGFLTIFWVGESMGHTPGAIIHAIQLVPIFILLLLAWERPLVGGMLLTAISILLGILYPFSTIQRLPVITIVYVESILFLPIFLSGICFLFSNKKSSKK